MSDFERYSRYNYGKHAQDVGRAAHSPDETEYDYAAPAGNDRFGVTAQIGDMLYELVPVEYSQSDIAAKILNGETLKTEYTFADRNAAASVSVGDYAAVYIEKAVYENVLVIPNGALYHTSAGDYVYLAGEDGNRKKTAVVCGFSDGVSTEIRDGISEGDVVYVRN